MAPLSKRTFTTGGQVETATDSAAFQVALARILVEPEVRRSFLADPEAAARDLGLDAEQLEALEAAGIDELDHFAATLLSKRLSMVSKLVPVTFKLLRHHHLVERLTPRFSEQYPPRKSIEYANRSARDAFWFTELLLRMIGDGEVQCSYLRDVARCERSQLRLATDAELIASAEAFRAAHDACPEPSSADLLAARPWRGAHSTVESFSCDVVEVIRSLAVSGEIPEVPERPVFLLFTKAPGWRNVRYARINDLTVKLLELCDGVRTTREIVAALLRASNLERDPEQLKSHCLAALRRLYDLNAIIFEALPKA